MDHGFLTFTAAARRHVGVFQLLQLLASPAAAFSRAIQFQVARGRSDLLEGPLQYREICRDGTARWGSSRQLTIALLLNSKIRGLGIYRTIVFSALAGARRRVGDALAVAVQCQARPHQHRPRASGRQQSPRVAWRCCLCDAGAGADEPVGRGEHSHHLSRWPAGRALGNSTKRPRSTAPPRCERSGTSRFPASRPSSFSIW